MAYYIEDRLGGPAIGQRRPSINEYFLSSYTMAVYDGCEFGCPYCDGWTSRARPFNETVRVALDLPDRVADELERIERGDLVGVTALTDPYQPAEAGYRLTRQVLRILADAGQPFTVLTKSHTVLEDLVLLERINEQSLGMVVFSLLTIDPYLSERLEDKAPSPALRLSAISELKRAGVPVGVAMLPVLPYVNDTDLLLNATLRAVSDAGADFVLWDFLHIPNERHRARVGEMLTRIGVYPPGYYRDMYRGQPTADPLYRAERDREIMALCDQLNLPVRPPHALYAGRLRPRNEAALLLKHAAFRDLVSGRVHLARDGQVLADLVFRGDATEAQLRNSPLFPELREILAREV
ncbi:MAG: hypothetical protein RLZZ387_1157 [Chloroflexota bacterium]|jgi:DNA repair photolyase